MRDMIFSSSSWNSTQTTRALRAATIPIGVETGRSEQSGGAFPFEGSRSGVSDRSFDPFDDKAIRDERRAKKNRPDRAA
ncbi:MAG: hypothetical protein O7G85_00340 [Planctomycetota bacterium]|nr:hypothetical protein [Planctomycetota bacterium]